MTTKLQQVIKAKVMAEAIAEAWAAEALAAEARAVVWAAAAEAKAARAKDLAEARADWTEAVARAVAKAEAKAAELLPHWAIIDPKSSEAS